MSRTRDLVALSAIFLVPLAAILIAQRPHDGEAVVAPDQAPVPALEAPAPVSSPAPLPPAPPPPVVTPEPAPASAEPPEPPAPPPARDPGQIMLLHDGALVLDTAPDPAWSSGKIRTSARSGRFVAARPAAAERVPKAARALAGATVTVHAADGSACVAGVGPFRVQVERTGDVYPYSESDGDDYGGYEPPGDSSVLRNMAREAFAEKDDDQLLLAAQHDQTGRACRGLWARRSDLPAPAVFGRRTLAEQESTLLAGRALAAVRAQPEFAEVRAAYAKRLADYGPDAELPSWEEFIADGLRAARWDEIGGPRRIVSVELREAPEGCGDFFEAGLALLFEQQGELLVRLAQPGWYDLEALFDLDRDGTFEGVVAGDFGLMRVEAVGASATAFRDSFSIEFLGCPC